MTRQVGDRSHRTKQATVTRYSAQVFVLSSRAALALTGRCKKASCGGVSRTNSSRMEEGCGTEQEYMVNWPARTPSNATQVTQHCTAAARRCLLGALGARGALGANILTIAPDSSKLKLDARSCCKAPCSWRITPLPLCELDQEGGSRNEPGGRAQI
jgi:hypothetical protein